MEREPSAQQSKMGYLYVIEAEYVQWSVLVSGKTRDTW